MIVIEKDRTNFVGFTLNERGVVPYATYYWLLILIADLGGEVTYIAFDTTLPGADEHGDYSEYQARYNKFRIAENTSSTDPADNVNGIVKLKGTNVHYKYTMYAVNGLKPATLAFPSTGTYRTYETGRAYLMGNDNSDIDSVYK